MIRKVPSYPFSTDEWVNAWHGTIGKDWELVGNNLARNGNELIIAGGYEVADYLDVVHPEEISKKFPGLHLTLRNVPEDSPTVAYFHMEREDTTPMMQLPPVLDKKYRHEMERKIRKFEREQTDIKIYDELNIDLLLTLMKLDKRKKIFLIPEMEAFFRKIAEQFQQHIIQTTVTVGGRPAATLLAFCVGDTLMSYNSGFDETNFTGAGFYLKAMHIKRAIDSGIKTYNFLQGNERYKYELGGKDFFVYKIDAIL